MRIRQLIKEYIELDEALATKCRTPDAQYHTKISDDKIETSVDIPSKILSELNEEQVETLESSAWYLWRYDRRQFDNHYMDKQTSIKRCDILRDNIKIAQTNILYIKSYIEPSYYRDVRLPELEKDVLRYSDQLENIIKSLKNVFDYSYDRE